MKYQYLLAAGCAVVLTGCSLFKSPTPGFKIYQHRPEIERQFGDNAQVTEEAIHDAYEWLAEFEWPTRGALVLVVEEYFQPGNKEREILVMRRFSVQASSNSTEGMLYGVNQSDNARDVAIGAANAAMAAASAGQTEVARILAEAARTVAQGGADDSTAETVGEILAGLEGVIAAYENTAPAEATETLDAVETTEGAGDVAAEGDGAGEAEPATDSASTE